MIAQGAFREDLFYRLNVIHIVVPPLRDRREDIALLAEHFIDSFSRRPTIADHRDSRRAAMKALVDYSWPGNVRELENVIERLVVTVRHEVITLEDLPSEIRAQDRVAPSERERRRTVADDLYKRLVEGAAVVLDGRLSAFMDREITRSNVRDLVRRGLEEARGNYKIVARIFNMDPRDYKRFLNFLRKHDCQIPFKEYR